MLNRVVLMGRLVADPELKTVGNDVSVVSIRIAVDRDYVKQGEERQADFFNVTAWRRTAEFISKYFTKGSMIAIDGQLQSRTYQAQDGTNRTVVEVVADKASFTGDGKGNAQGASARPAPTKKASLDISPIDDEDDLPFTMGDKSGKSQSEPW